LDSEVVRTL